MQDVLGNRIAGCREHCSEFFDEMRSITSLLQLLEDSDNDIIVDALKIKFGVGVGAW